MSANSSAPKVQLPTDKELVMTVIPMPGDCNANGDIFSGWVMAQADLAGAVIPARYAKGRMATVAGAPPGRRLKAAVPAGTGSKPCSTLQAFADTSLAAFPFLMQRPRRIGVDRVAYVRPLQRYHGDRAVLTDFYGFSHGTH